MRDLWRIFGLVCVVALLQACTGDSFTSSAAAPGQNGGGTAAGCTEDPTAPGCTVTAASIVATIDKVSIKSDGFDSATISATVLDGNRGSVSGAQVEFSATSGRLSSGVAYTDENGNATVKFYASPDNPSNGVVTVLASVSGVGSYAVPVTIYGTNLAVSAKDGQNTLVVTSTSSTKTVLVKATDAAGLGAYGQSISVSLAGDEGGTVAAPAGTTITPNPAITDISGTATFTLTGQTSGDVWITATGLGTTAQGEFSVQDQNAFTIATPTPATGDDFVQMTASGTTQVITVTAGLTNVAAGSTVRFATSIGTWDDGSNIGGAYTDVTFSAVDATTGSASATLHSSTGDNGFATVYAFVVGDVKKNDSISVVMSPPVSAAAQVIVQTDEKTIFPSSATTEYSTKVHLQVRTDLAAGNYPIADAPVSLKVQNATGGGEYVTQTAGFTDVYGNFETTFVSGVTSTGQIGVQILGTEDTNSNSDFATVEIGGTPGSVALGTPRDITINEENLSINTYVMSALVADGTGAAVSGANVTLHFWPTQYYTGFWVKTINPVSGDDEYLPFVTGTFANEDVNENGIMDPGEDVNGNGQLDPPASFAGTAPPIVTTDTDGAAPFNYVYLKDAAHWIKVRAQGSTRVFGTEATSKIEFIPKGLKTEEDQGIVNDSPFPLWLTVSVADVAGDALIPGTASPWMAPGTIGFLDKGTIAGASSNTIQLPAGTTYVAGDTVTVLVTLSSGPQFDANILFIP